MNLLQLEKDTQEHIGGYLSLCMLHVNLYADKCLKIKITECQTVWIQINTDVLPELV